jgi:hypothetical protein
MSYNMFPDSLYLPPCVYPQKLRKRAIELNNGRAAMMGILGLMMHEQIDGNPVIGVFLEY